MIFGKIEAGETKALFGQSVDDNARVQMPAKSITGFTLLAMFVAKAKVVIDKILIPNLNISLPVPVVVQDIMVASNQVKVYAEIVPPAFEPIQFQIGFTMKKVPNRNDLSGLEVLQQVHQPLQVFFKNTLGNGYARLPEVPGLAKMQI